MDSDYRVQQYEHHMLQQLMMQHLITTAVQPLCSARQDAKQMQGNHLSAQFL
jgi:hypothetical protein